MPHRYPNFDFLRLLLAFEVFANHTCYIADHSFNWYTFIEPVPAFLALSGFLVLKSYSESSGPAEFFGKRALRVLPALPVAIGLCLVLFGWDTAWNSIKVWVTGGLTSQFSPTEADAPLWSLLWEEIAYVSLVLLMFAGGYRRPAFIFGLIVGAVALVWWNAAIDGRYKIILFLPISFLVGNLMYLCRDQLMKVDPFVPVVAFLVALEWRQLPATTLMGGATIPLIEGFAIVWVGMAGKQILPWRIPDLSYSLYIFHWPVVAFLNESLGLTWLPGLFVVSLVILVPLTLASWYFIERPALRLKPRLLSRRPAPLPQYGFSASSAPP